ncbi:LysM peptidoglycan-binding domain-containing protein [Sporosarcina sp. G11-34]|uniref:LysM peptidoglycan-binding domain-containing protein n=1 Tax=Sporosarcina sp. G11-34 TaxID=2849605 RepID=UPI0022A8E525|nr:LysM peptidoglycan-binding domain-containing protein [Sporosarcina sp. G11-34]MCZ2258399.1 LysM peptidoglycan-binding domain-containing protein [Sporosarcina sp. G11-34]
MKVHVVVRGDTLWKISRQYGIPFEELKRVNAHLANPDYIVPGMKIFLPEKHSGSKGEGKEHVKGGGTGPEHVKPTTPAKPEHRPEHKQEHKPAHKPEHKPAHKQEHKQEHKPAHKQEHKQEHKPAHKQEHKQEHKPEHRPEHKPATPIPKPTPPIPPVQPVPPMQPMPPQMHPMPPMPPQMHPIYAIPCGWMPIFDADCHPFIHPGQIQHVPMPAAPPPMPSPTFQEPVFGIDDETYLESTGPIPMPKPVQNSVPYGWKMLESPEFPFEEPLTFNRPAPQPSPEFIQQEESAIEQEQFNQPEFQQPMMPYPPMQMPMNPCGCPPASNCGCGGSYSMPAQAPMNFCNACSQPIQAMPYPMMPYPQHRHNWYGSY